MTYQSTSCVVLLKMTSISVRLPASMARMGCAVRKPPGWVWSSTMLVVVLSMLCRCPNLRGLTLMKVSARCWASRVRICSGSS